MNEISSVFKITATRCNLLGLKCTKFDFGWGSALPQTLLGELTALSQTPLGGFEGRTSKRRKGKGGKGRGGKERVCSWNFQLC